MSTQSNTDVVKDLRPQSVWRFFAGLADTPRCSKKEEKVRAHLKGLAKELGFTAKEDRVGNIVIEVPATKGHENAPIVVLQGHVDMVCEKNSGTLHDFDNDPIKLIVGKDTDTGRVIVHADGTTLGADNGIGIALALAAATEPDVVHGPLELLCTIDEEMGMTGADALTPDFFKGRRLLNLDSEEDNAVYIGCAGGCDTNMAWTLATDKPHAALQAIRISVSGLRGGHSGGDIHENRGNAIKCLVATLSRCATDGLQLAQLSGGSKRNAIPREASALLVGPAGALEALRETAKQVRQVVAKEHAEPGAAISVDPADAGDAPAVCSASDTRTLLDGLLAIPSGVLGMSTKVAGLVQTSNNLSTLTSEVGGKSLKVLVGCLTRSSSDAWKNAVAGQLAAIGRLSGAQVESDGGYPGWEPNPDSYLLKTCSETYKKLFLEDANVTAIHAGLECGIIGDRIGDIDTISFGPTITGAHSPDELVYVDAVEKSWKFLKAVLAELA